ncbi:TetR/AcrR family transcriptional regulator [Streptomyces adustus]|uniref:TetR/AcrR family transcriptional regulator n=1 Tax=Streptomyces adustus TaxID=1609272 RepID=A0A5N8V4U0_9ACTN|nr:TetR/AcrR family transcriptional regulator [Streptomyces adustus]MPY30177.1 TetR/AcrR family transcriptional regulator [Streptomyces adustus]
MTPAGPPERSAERCPRAWSSKSTTSPAQRLLDTASVLFAKEGIRAVGIERILTEADVARASLYQNFGSKDALVAAYLDRQHETVRAGHARATARLTDPVERILAPFDLSAKDARRRGFRGCLFLKALTEFPETRHPARAAVERHRTWLTGIWRDELAAAGAADPETTSAKLELLYDGGLAGCKSVRSAEPVARARRMALDVLRQALPADRLPSA